MEKKNINKEQAISFAKTGLETIGYFDVLEIKEYITDDGQPNYDAYISSDVMHNGLKTKILKPLSQQDFIKLIYLGMIVSGYDIKYIKPIIRDKKVTYQAMVNIASYPSVNKKVKRR